MAKKIQHRIRRSNNEGSIFQRKSDGKWVGSITVGHDEKGQQKKNSLWKQSSRNCQKTYGHKWQNEKLRIRNS